MEYFIIIFDSPGLIIARSSSTRSAPSDTLVRGSQMTGGDSEGYFEGDPEYQDPEDGGPQEDGGQDDERDGDEDEEGNDAFPTDDVVLR